MEFLHHILLYYSMTETFSILDESNDLRSRGAIIRAPKSWGKNAQQPGERQQGQKWKEKIFSVDYGNSEIHLYSCFHFCGAVYCSMGGLTAGLLFGQYFDAFFPRFRFVQLAAP